MSLLSDNRIPPSTINDCIDILAYNDHLWEGFSPHQKDIMTVRSLSESQYAWTEKQAKLATSIVKRYKTLFQKFNINVDGLCNNPVYRDPFRVIDYEKSISIIDIDGEEYLRLKFPYDKKIIALVKNCRNKNNLPDSYFEYDGDKKLWVAKMTEVTVYYLTLIAIRYDFKFVTPELYDLFLEVKQERFVKNPGVYFDNTLKFTATSESFNEYWKENYSKKSLIQQTDALKLFGFSIPKNLKSWYSDPIMSHKIATSRRDVYINKDKTRLQDLLVAMEDLDLFPCIVPVTGAISEPHELYEWKEWIDTIEQKYGNTKSMAFGFDVKQPNLPEQNKYSKNIDEVTMELADMENEQQQAMVDYQINYDLYLLTKTNKWIDENTKFIFVRNRLPRTLIKSGIKIKTAMMSIGGGLWSPYGDLINTMVENCDKRMYYTTTSPITEDEADKI